ncbi:hypothetical protein COOONC_26026 [Cooperia oncophora]
MAKLKRGARFGFTSVAGSTDYRVEREKEHERFVTCYIVSSEKEMKAKRAERFGLTGQTSPELDLSIVMKNERKNVLIEAKDPVKVQTKPVAVKTGAALDDEIEQKKRARLERFGLK